jgi:hypothetical protein
VTETSGVYNVGVPRPQPAEVNPLVLPSVALEQHNSMPKSPGIYFALSESGEVLYIGKASNLRTRWRRHHKYHELKSIGNVKIAWLEFDSAGGLLQSEGELIDYISPRLNQTPGYKPKALKHKFDKSKSESPKWWQRTSFGIEDVASELGMSELDLVIALDWDWLW